MREGTQRVAPLPQGPTRPHYQLQRYSCPHFTMSLHPQVPAMSPCSLCQLTPCLYSFFFLFSTDFLFCGPVTALSPPPLPTDVRLSSPSRASHHDCHCPSKRPNCSCGTCSGLVTWRTRCTADALSRTRHVVPTLPLLLIAHVTVLLNGGASPMTPALSMTHASVQVLVPFPQLSPHVHSYRSITPNPCALGQQVTVILSCSIVLSRLVYFYPDHS